VIAEYKMRFVEFILQSIPLVISLYAKKYLDDDLAQTLVELENDSSLPRIKTYDFIVGEFGFILCSLK
jgi:hypothetical protein